MKSSESTNKKWLTKFFKFHKREVKQFNEILGIRTDKHAKKC